MGARDGAGLSGAVQAAHRGQDQPVVAGPRVVDRPTAGATGPGPGLAQLLRRHPRPTIVTHTRRVQETAARRPPGAAGPPGTRPLVGRPGPHGTLTPGAHRGTRPCPVRGSVREDHHRPRPPLRRDPRRRPQHRGHDPPGPRNHRQAGPGRSGERRAQPRHPHTRLGCAADTAETEDSRPDREDQPCVHLANLQRLPTHRARVPQEPTGLPVCGLPAPGQHRREPGTRHHRTRCRGRTGAASAWKQGAVGPVRQARTSTCCLLGSSRNPGHSMTRRKSTRDRDLAALGRERNVGAMARTLELEPVNGAVCAVARLAEIGAGRDDGQDAPARGHD